MCSFLALGTAESCLHVASIKIMEMLQPLLYCILNAEELESENKSMLSTLWRKSNTPCILHFRHVLISLGTLDSHIASHLIFSLQNLPLPVLSPRSFCSNTQLYPWEQWYHSSSSSDIFTSCVSRGPLCVHVSQADGQFLWWMYTLWERTK